jgi:hypothetical protein
MVLVRHSEVNCILLFVVEDKINDEVKKEKVFVKQDNGFLQFNRRENDAKVENDNLRKYNRN